MRLYSRLFDGLGEPQSGRRKGLAAVWPAAKPKRTARGVDHSTFKMSSRARLTASRSVAQGMRSDMTERERKIQQLCNERIHPKAIGQSMTVSPATAESASRSAGPPAERGRLLFGLSLVGDYPSLLKPPHFAPHVLLLDTCVIQQLECRR